MRNQQGSSPYSPGSFHFTRALLWISTLIVMSIMIYFAVQLHASKLKFPYVFLITLITCALTLLTLTFTTLLYSSNHLRPSVSLLMTILLFILWALSLAFLGYGMRGTLMTTCDTSSWGTSTGVMVCKVYKTLFSFMVIALASTFLHAIIDFVARRDGEHLSMLDGGGDTYRDDYKMHVRGESGESTSATPLAHGIVAMNSSSPPATEHTNANVDEIRAAGDVRTDAYNAFGTVRQANTATNTAHDNSNNDNYQHQQDDDAEYYDGIPDVPPASGVRWTAMRPSPYSPLETRFDEQQSGYEAYRPYRTAYDDGGYVHRG